MTGVCIVGAGLSGGIHARALRDVQSARLVTVTDIAGAQARAFAGTWKVPRWYSSLDEALRDEEVDVVHLCTPPFLHEEQVKQIAAAGKHVIVEKPLARNVREADAIIAACDAANVTLGAVFQHRFLPLARKVKAALEARQLGRVYLADAYVKWYRDDAYYRASGWRATRDKEGGGALINQSIHSIDLLQWLMGPVAEVTGRTTTAAHQIETEDVGLALLRFRDGALGVIEGSTATYPGFPERIELHGENGTVILNEGKNCVEWYIKGEEQRVEGATSEEGYAHDPASISTIGHAAQFMDFYSAIQEGRKPAVDGREGRKALEVIEAVYVSARTGESVLLPLSNPSD